VFGVGVESAVLSHIALLSYEVGVAVFDGGSERHFGLIANDGGQARSLAQFGGVTFRLVECPRFFAHVEGNAKSLDREPIG
jgi:hypothetical protein